MLDPGGLDEWVNLILNQISLGPNQLRTLATVCNLDQNPFKRPIVGPWLPALLKAGTMWLMKPNVHDIERSNDRIAGLAVDPAERWLLAIVSWMMGEFGWLAVSQAFPIKQDGVTQFKPIINLSPSAHPHIANIAWSCDVQQWGGGCTDFSSLPISEKILESESSLYEMNCMIVYVYHDVIGSHIFAVLPACQGTSALDGHSPMAYPRIN